MFLRPLSKWQQGGELMPTQAAHTLSLQPSAPLNREALKIRAPLTNPGMGLVICLTDQESCQMGLWGTEKGRGLGEGNRGRKKVWWLS